MEYFKVCALEYEAGLSGLCSHWRKLYSFCHQISKLLAEITLSNYLEILINFLYPCQTPTGETLEQFVCFALSRVPKDEANKENNEDDCISTWHEAKIYLVHAVSKLRLYAQVY